MRDTTLDDFRDLSAWSIFASGEAELRISPEPGDIAPSMRLNFDFHGGGGFVVARKAFALAIPDSFSFAFSIRGSGPRNNFEFKLVDGPNRNVWRYRVEGFEFPEDWRRIEISDREVEFAWGPLGGGPPRDIAAIELVIAAGPGGKGTASFMDLRLQDTTYRSIPTADASSSLPGHDPRNVLDPSAPSSWRSESGEAPQWLGIDFQEERDFGGLVVHWEPHLSGRAFRVEISSDSAAWLTAYATSQGGAETNYLYLPNCRARHVRFHLLQSAEGHGFGIRRIEVKPHDFSRSLNHFFQAVAQDHPPGYFPKYLSGRQTYWTVLGAGQGDGPALVNEEGMVEVDKGSFSVVPFLYAQGRLLTWTEAELDQGLTRGDLPIPVVSWRTEGLAMKVTAFAAPNTDGPVLILNYKVENTADHAQVVALFAAILPFQVTPTWQNWRSFGGVSPIREISFVGPQAAPESPDAVGDAGHVQVNGEKAVIPLSRPVGFGAAAFAEGGVASFLARGELPSGDAVLDEFGFASGALRFDLDLPPGSAKDVTLAVPFGTAEATAGAPLPCPQPQGHSAEGVDKGGIPVFQSFPRRRESSLSGNLRSAACPGMTAAWRLSTSPVSGLLEEATRQWESLLDAVDIRLPPGARAVADTLRTAAAHILINRDGPALHPGPRRYSRSWIRDGVLMGAALLRVGLSSPLRDFLNWYKDSIAQDGRIPDCVDRDGAEWLPEFDAYGQFLFGIVEHYRFTGDRAFLEEMRQSAGRALSFMEGLRNTRITEEYRQPEKRACYGLMPESMSHEGYMAHPVHAYWDDFWALQGFGDASAMAAVLGDSAEAARLALLRDEFYGDVATSLRATISRHAIEYVPGSVEFGDFDPAATSIAAGLLDQIPLLPRLEIDRTFDKYMAGFRDRAANAVDWNNYSAYEIRIVGALVRLGRRRDALDLLTFLLADRRIPAWNQWPEISWRDPASPSFMGDLPHTWISAEYILATASLFAYERGADQSLVIAAGVDPGWLTDGFEVGVRDFPTRYGRLSYRMRWDSGDVLGLTLEGDLRMPQGGIVVLPPLDRPIRSVAVNGKPSSEYTAEGFTCRECPARVEVSV